ncbi:MAG: hypothetical protein ACFFCI_09365 [Promethearchaeota archaeon]
MLINNKKWHRIHILDANELYLKRNIPSSEKQFTIVFANSDGMPMISLDPHLNEAIKHLKKISEEK